MVVGALIFLLTFVGTIAITAFVLVRLPPDYFDSTLNRPFMVNWPWPARLAGLIGKNLLGVVTIATGIALSLPGIPGQGLLMILLGLMLMDIPGKRVIVHRIARIPRVISTINKLRARYGKQPLIVN